MPPLPARSSVLASPVQCPQCHSDIRRVTAACRGVFPHLAAQPSHGRQDTRGCRRAKPCSCATVAPGDSHPRGVRAPQQPPPPALCWLGGTRTVTAQPWPSRPGGGGCWSAGHWRWPPAAPAASRRGGIARSPIGGRSGACGHWRHTSGGRGPASSSRPMPGRGRPGTGTGAAGRRLAPSRPTGGSEEHGRTVAPRTAWTSASRSSWAEGLRLLLWPQEGNKHPPPCGTDPLG